MTHQAYKSAQVATEDPRLTEYRLFGQVTGALLNAKQSNAIGTESRFRFSGPRLPMDGDG